MSGWVVGISAAAVAGASIYSAERQSSAQKKAAKMQAETARAQMNREEQQFNRQNQNKVDMESLLAGESAGGSLGSTMMTGAQGVDKNKMNLGQSQLLGG